jgi:hypothetical protein|tara:strand:+ start:169 stop:759 length:591 start_codon:yes stop_codon:yes gene_type:complete
MSDYRENKKLLSVYFPEEIAIIILDQKYHLECDGPREEMIERDFYNWLTNDANIRDSYRDNIFTNQHCEYYINNLESLGLNSMRHTTDNLRRTKSLSDCYKSPWYKTTAKASVEWNAIHIYITVFHDDFVFIWDKSIRPGSEDTVDMITHNWRRPNLSDKLKIWNMYPFSEIEMYHRIWLLTGETLLLSNDILTIL